jgi:hypothetical protein
MLDFKKQKVLGKNSPGLFCVIKLQIKPNRNWEEQRVTAKWSWRVQIRGFSFDSDKANIKPNSNVSIQ